MSVIHNDLLLATDEATGYNLTKSLRFRSAASAYLNRTPSSTGNRRTWTYSVWFKRGSLGGSTTKNLLTAYVGSGSSVDTIDLLNDNIRFFFNGSSSSYLVTSQVFRDPSAWYHLVATVDTTQATSSNRMKLYINGTQITSFSSATYPTQNYDTFVNLASYPQIIGNSGFSSDHYDGYLAEAILVDGQALTPSSFGETDTITGVWKPKRYTGTYGTNGFYLPFTDVATTSGSNAGLGKDFSGNGNYWTTNNISVTAGTTYDSMTDVPTLTSATAANYAVINPLRNLYNSTIVDGNLKFTTYGPTTGYTPASIGVSSGKFYWEVTYIGNAGNTNLAAGIANATAQNSDLSFSSAGIWSYYSGNGQKYNSGSGTAYGSSWTTAGDVIGVALDADAGTLTFYKNNTSQGTAYTGLASSTYFPVLGCFGGDTSYNTTVAMNFGQQPFKYTPPTGFKALNTYNLPDSTIVAGNKVMDATTYTGNASTTNIVNAAPFKPDLVWIKSRSNAYSHFICDSVRGVSRYISSNNTDAEVYDPGYEVTSFNSNGFGLANNSGTNGNGATYVGWQWQAGQGTTSSNTSGSITSTVSVNASAGFSIVTYTGNGTAGATVGHGLGVAPSLVVCKNRQAATSWPFYHSYLGGTNWLLLNSTSATTTSSQEWNNTSPTSSVFSIGSSSSNSNQSANTYVAYCWSEISGYSKFGGYTGNSSSDGIFIYLGFRPKFIFIKNYQSATDWYFEDSSRDTYNVASSVLLPNSSAAETSGTYLIDFLSNGFKIRTASGNINSSGNSYIYGCWAENPFKNSLAR